MLSTNTGLAPTITTAATPTILPKQIGRDIDQFMKLTERFPTMIEVLYSVAGIIVAAWTRRVEIAGIRIKKCRNGEWLGTVKCGIRCHDDEPIDSAGATEVLFLTSAGAMSVAPEPSKEIHYRAERRDFGLIYQFIPVLYDACLPWQPGNDTRTLKLQDMSSEMMAFYTDYCDKCAEALLIVERDMVAALIQALQEKHRVRRLEVNDWLESMRNSVVTELPSLLPENEATVETHHNGIVAES